MERRKGLFFKDKYGIPGPVRDRAFGYLTALTLLLAGDIVATIYDDGPALQVVFFMAIMLIVIMLSDLNRYEPH